MFLQCDALAVRDAMFLQCDVLAVRFSCSAMFLQCDETSSRKNAMRHVLLAASHDFPVVLVWEIMRCGKKVSSCRVGILVNIQTSVKVNITFTIH